MKGCVDRRVRPGGRAGTRACFNLHEAPPRLLRVVRIRNAIVVVCSPECEDLARRRIERRAASGERT